MIMRGCASVTGEGAMLPAVSEGSHFAAGRWHSRTEAAMIRASWQSRPGPRSRSTIRHVRGIDPCSSTASPIRKARSSPTSRRRTSAITSSAPMLRLGRAEGSDAGRARGNARGVRAARAGGRGRAHGHQRPKIEEYGDSLFAVLHTVEPRDGELHVGEVDIFVGTNYVLSVRTRYRARFRRRARTVANASPTCSSTARRMSSTR